MSDKKYIFQNIAVFIVGFCIPFFSVTISFAGVWSVSILSIALYGVSMTPLLYTSFKIGRYYGRFVFIPFYYFLFLTLINLIYYDGGGAPIVNTTLFLCFLFFILLLIHANKDSKAMLICLYGIAFGCILQSILATMGVGVEINPDNMRLELFGMNPNSVGIMMCMGAIIIFSEFVMKDCLKLGLWRFLFLLAAIPISATIVLTGSRTAVVLFVAAIIVILFFNPVKSKFIKYAVIILGAIALFFVAQKFMTEDNVLVERIEMSTESGDLSGRDALWKDIVPAILESPIWGYGETGYYGFVAKKALGVELSPHNVFLEVLALTGMIGLIMWLIFWSKIFRYAWYCYKKEKVLLPMLMLLPMIVCLLSGQFITVSWAYILYAYVISEYNNIHGIINFKKVNI